MPDPALHLDGALLTPALLSEAAHTAKAIELSRDGMERMVASRALIDEAVATGTPVYGVTRGLGARATETLDSDALADFSYRTIRGRAAATGAPLPDAVVRAGMLVRLNTLLIGATGAHPDIARHLKACLEAGLTPVVGETGSIGVADLLQNATMAVALIGEGPMRDGEGRIVDGREAMAAVGITPPRLGPRDGLALASHSGLSAGLSALSVVEARRAFDAAQAGAALSLIAFRGNLTPFDPRVLALRPHAGTERAAADILARLRGSVLEGNTSPRRIQDPLSFRNLPQIQGMVWAALDQAEADVTGEINGVSDNPVTLTEQAEVLSSGNFLAPHLAHSVEGVSRALTRMAMAQVARISKLLSARFTDLPLFLADPVSGSNGLAPLTKTAEAAAMALSQAAAPAPVWPSIGADGVEDVMADTWHAATALGTVVEHLWVLIAVEAAISVRAIELRGDAGHLGPDLASMRALARSHFPEVADDLPLGSALDSLVSALREHHTA